MLDSGEARGKVQLEVEITCGKLGMDEGEGGGPLRGLASGDQSPHPI